MTCKSTSTHPYGSAAQEKFQELKNAYASKGTGQSVRFWKLGNTFDTMIDFLDTIDDSSAADVAKMVGTQFNASQKTIGGGLDGAWFDDFGWWSIASQRALYKPFFQTHAGQIQNILDQCWTRFTGNAPFVWERRAPGTFEDWGPAVDGGVWNAYWQGTPNQYPGPKEGNPSDGGLVGIQNTVTNALYLMTAQRLGRTDPDTRQAAQKELHFFLTWFDDKQDPLWWQFDENTALVRERVGHYANGKCAPSNPSACTGFQENWAWTGDQGLILGALGDAMLDLDPVSRGPLLTRAQELLSGVFQHLTDGSGIVQSDTTQSSTRTGCVPRNDTDDYQTGSGVFWRNVLYVWKTNPDLRTFLSSQDYQEMVKASADDAVKRQATRQSFEMLTNDLAVLLAAYAMLEQHLANSGY